MKDIPLCDFEPASFLIFSSNVPVLIYYTHILALILTVGLGLFIIFKNPKGLANRALFFALIPFWIWVGFNLPVWAMPRSDIVMFLWSIQVLIEPLIFAGMLYLVYVIIDEKDVPFRYKMIWAILFFPVMVITPTTLSLIGFDLNYCIPVENPISYYTYIVETIYLSWLAVFAVRRHKQADSKEIKGKIFIISTGAVLFLLAFAAGNIVGSLTDEWVLGQIGLFGTPVFIFLLVYAIIKFKAFNIKILGANALVVALLVLTISLLLFKDIETMRKVIVVTLAVSGVLGFMLIRNVNNEAKTRERIETLATDLKFANNRLQELDKQKSEFVSLASHQLRGPLTAIKGYVSLILEKDYGEISKDVEGALGKVRSSVNDLAILVGDYLDVSRIELGKMKYEISTFALNDLIDEVIGELLPTIENSKLKLNVNIDKLPSNISADRNKIKQVVLNLIDNSIKYTPEGGITISLKRDHETTTFCVKDTGVGIPQSVLPNLFQKFSRAPKASSTNISGTGLGLYVAKQIIEEHEGRIWVESGGEGKGAAFYIELKLI